MPKFEIKGEEMFAICIEEVGTRKSVEEYQAFGDYKNGKFEKIEKDTLNIWVGKDESGKYYLGIAGRQPDNFGQGYHYFRTIGFQEITKEDYEAFIKIPSFSKTK